MPTRRCRCCTAFVLRYADAVGKATGRPVDASNLSQHNGLTLPRLLAELETFHVRLAAADVIVVGIAHNNLELFAPEPCGAVRGPGGLPDWSKLTAACGTAAAARTRPMYEKLFSQIATWRRGKPTILRAVNRYNDWIGLHDATVTMTPAAEARTRLIIEPFNAVLCAAATKYGFGCADLYHAFNGPTGRTPPRDLLAADYLHPSDKGNIKIAQVPAKLGFAPLA